MYAPTFEGKEKNNENSVNMNLIFEIQDELENLVSFNSIHGALLFRIDGIMIESVYNSKENLSFLPTITWIKSIITKVGSELRSNLYRIAYSRVDEHIYFYKVGEVGILACILNKFANLGLLAIEMDRIAFKIANLIS